MSNLAHTLSPTLKVAHKALQSTNSGLLQLLMAANFDKKRIVIADYDLSDHFLTLYLEDKKSPVADLSDALMYKLPVSRFAEVIKSEGLNSYEGTLYNESGRTYEGRIGIAKPIKWYNQDATLFQQESARDAALTCILKNI